MGNGDFSFKRDFKYIKWKATLWLNFLRAAFAGPIITILMAITGEPFSQAASYLLFPLIYFGAGLPLGLGMALLSGLGVPFVWIFTALLSLFVALGDPFVFILHKIKPEIVPVEKFSIFNFELIMFVVDEGRNLGN